MIRVSARSRHIVDQLCLNGIILRDRHLADVIQLGAGLRYGDVLTVLILDRQMLRYGMGMSVDNCVDIIGILYNLLCCPAVMGLVLLTEVSEQDNNVSAFLSRFISVLLDLLIQLSIVLTEAVDIVTFRILEKSRRGRG